MEICSIFTKNWILYQKPDACIFVAQLSTILMVILNNTHTSVCSPDVEFVSQPHDVSAKEDTSASFHCTLTSRVPFSSANSYWENGLTETLRHNDLYNVTTIPDTINQRIRSYLTINKAKRDMSPLYKCRITIIFLDDSPKIISSDFATLNVLYFLNDNELHCSGPSSSVLREGDQVSVECKGVQTNPNSVLRWLRSFPASSSLFQTIFSQAGSVLHGNITATHLLHKNVLICVAENEAFPKEHVNCSLGPFKVIHSPVVEVIPAHTDMIWPLVSEMMFQCIASGYPDIDQYEWFCHPQEIFGQCSSNVSNLTIVIQDVRTARNLNITCEARNDVAKTQRTSTIIVEYIPESMIPTCNSSTPGLPQMSYHGKPSVQYNVATGVAQCSAEVQSIELTIFRWYLEGLLKEENDGEHVVKSYDGGSHLVVYDSLTLQRRPGIIACSIRFDKYDELRIEQLTACKMSFALDYMIINSSESWHAMAYSDIGSTEQHISAKTIKDLENVSMVSSSIQQDQDLDTISELIVSTPKFNSYVTITTSESKGLAGGFQIFAIPALIASGILSFLIIIIVLIGKSEICKFAGTNGPCVQLAAHEEMQFDIRRSTTSDVEEDRCYEIPDPETRPSNPNRCREIDPDFSSVGRRHIDIDSFVEGESASNSSTESTGSLSSCSYSSPGNSTYQYLQDDESDAPCLHHYENQEVVKSVIGNARSKYFRARIAEIGGKERFACERPIHSDITFSFSKESSSL